MIGDLVQQGVLTHLGASSNETPTTAQLSAGAKQLGIPLARFTKDCDAGSFRDWLGSEPPDVVLVFGMSHKIPAEALKIPRHGFLNFHGGILPKYRGPLPVFWQICNGESHGGITVHRMDEDWDTGPIAHVEREPIGDQDTAGIFSLKLAGTAMRAAAAVLGPLAATDTLQTQPQIEAAADYQGRPTAKDLTIDWPGMTARKIDCLVRAANPELGGARAGLKGMDLATLQTTIVDSAKPVDAPAGTVTNASRELGIEVQCSDGKQLRIEVVSGPFGVMSSERMIDCLGVRAGDRFEPGSVAANDAR